MEVIAACTVAISVAAGLGNLAHAQEGSDKTKEFVLDEVVVTATRTPNTVFNANANINVITQEQIEQMHFQTVEEALRTVPGLQFLNYNLAGYNLSRVRINGSDQVLVLVDGVKATMTGSGVTCPFNLISNMDTIERIEVLHGSAAVLYGSEAKGGVINIITKKAKTNQTKVNMAGGSFDTERYSIVNEGSDEKWSYRVYGQKFIQGDTEDAKGVKWKGHQNQKNSGISLTNKINKTSDLTFTFNENKEDFSLYDHLYKQDVDGFANYTDTTITYNAALSNTLKNTLSYRHSRFEHRAILHDPRWGDNVFWYNHFKSRVITDQLTKTYGNTHVVSAGFEDVKTNSVKQRRREPDCEMSVRSYFLQDEWKMDDKWKLTSGVRYDSPSGGIVDIPSNTAKSFNLGYTFDAKHNVYVASNDYFVLPSMFQLYHQQWGNPKLLPEKGRNYEVGYNHIFDDTTALSAHYFKRNSNQNIGFDDEEDTYVNDTEKANGFDLQLRKQFGKAWNTYVGYSHLNYENETGTTSFGYLPKNLVNIGINYTQDKWDIGLDGRGFLGRDGNEVKSEGWPSDRYWVFNLGINYKATKNMKTYVTVNNLFNQLYAEHTKVIWWGKPGEWYGMPGRNIIAGVEMKF